MDAYGNPSSAEILEELAAIRAARLRIERQRDVSESINGSQIVHNGMGHLKTLREQEQVLRAELTAALDREGIGYGHSGTYQIFPRGY